MIVGPFYFMQLKHILSIVHKCQHLSIITMIIIGKGLDQFEFATDRMRGVRFNNWENGTLQ